MKNKIFTTKPINDILSESENSGKGLKRTLTATNLTTLGIGAIIGAGIFVITGQAAAQYAGPAIVFRFIISGIACAFAGLCYAEFASMIPIAGSAYTYAYATMGEFFAWLIGWDLILEYLFAASTVSVGWSGYMVSFLKDFGVHIPAYLTAATGSTLVYLQDTGWVMETTATDQPALGSRYRCFLPAPYDGLDQPPGHVHHRHADHTPGHRHQGISQLQQHHGHRQSLGDHLVYSTRVRFCPGGTLEAFYPA